MTEHELADKWITELEEAGFTPDQMIKVFRLAREKYLEMQETRNEQQQLCGKDLKMNINIRKESDTRYTVRDDAGVKIIDVSDNNSFMFIFLDVRYNQINKAEVCEHCTDKNGNNIGNMYMCDYCDREVD